MIKQARRKRNAPYSSFMLPPVRSDNPIIPLKLQAFALAFWGTGFELSRPLGESGKNFIGIGKWPKLRETMLTPGP